MKDESIPEQHFEANRARLLAVAYRMLGSRSEAEDRPGPPGGNGAGTLLD